MSIIGENAYICSLKEKYLSEFCSSCFRRTTNRCRSCRTIVYCDDQCQIKDSDVHQDECQFYRENRIDSSTNEFVLVRMIIRLINQLKLDDGQPNEDLCENLPSSIRRRSWNDLLSHRDEILQSDRHKNLWLKTENQFEKYFSSKFDQIDLLEIFGKLLINRFRVGIHENLLDGRIAIGWAIYLTISGLNHSCQPDFYQCSFNLQIRLKSSENLKEIPCETSEFYRLTLSYRHQNDFRPENWISYVPRRNQRRTFLKFFFFNCHCRFCSDEKRFEHEEYLSQHQCSTCQRNLIVKPIESIKCRQWILICSNEKCSSSSKHQIHRQIPNEMKFNENNSMEILEEILFEYEQIFHRFSLILIQMKEFLVYRYSKENSNDFQRIQRRIDLSEDLIEFYQFYFSSSSTIYPKIFLQDLAFLYRSINKNDRAQQLIDKAKQLWINDYQHHLDYKPLQI